jgi:lia operon protein LiaG
VLETGSGSITLDLLSDVRNARVNTGSGSVTVSMPSDLGAELLVDSGSGGIDFDMPVKVIQKKRSSLRGTLGDGQGRFEIDTGSGGIHLRAR